MQRRQALSIHGTGAALYGAGRHFGNAWQAARDVSRPPGRSPVFTDDAVLERRGDFPNGAPGGTPW